MKKADLLRPFSNVDNLNPTIAGRWSSRAFDPTTSIPEDVLERLFEAARWAPSSMNNQPWRFMVFDKSDQTALEKAQGTLKAGNSWALRAPVLLFALSRSDWPDSGAVNSRSRYEAGMSVAQMALQAAEEGLAFHQMAGFSIEQFIQNFRIPGNMEPIVAIAIGYPGDIEKVPENRRSMETEKRSRKELSQILFRNGEVPTS